MATRFQKTIGAGLLIAMGGAGYLTGRINRSPLSVDVAAPAAVATPAPPEPRDPLIPPEAKFYYYNAALNCWQYELVTPTGRKVYADCRPRTSPSVSPSATLPPSPVPSASPSATATPVQTPPPCVCPPCNCPTPKPTIAPTPPQPTPVPSGTPAFPSKPVWVPAEAQPFKYEVSSGCWHWRLDNQTFAQCGAIPARQ